MAELIGLCQTCVHSRRVPNPRLGGFYWLCLLSETDLQYAKYPRLPVLQCPGYERVIEEGRE